MLKVKDIEAECQDFVSTRKAAREPLAVPWMTHAIVALHPAPEFPDRDWYLVTAFETIRTLLGRVTRSDKHEKTTEGDRSGFLPGFEYLQAWYDIDRDGERVVVPIEQCSRPELEAKAEEIRRMGRGCFAHALEIERYLDERERGEVG